MVKVGHMSTCRVSILPGLRDGQVEAGLHASMVQNDNPVAASEVCWLLEPAVDGHIG